MNTFSSYYFCVRGNFHPRVTCLVILCFITGVFSEFLHHPSSNLMEPDADVRRFPHMKNLFKRVMREPATQQFEERSRATSSEELEPIAELWLPADPSASKVGHAGKDGKIIHGNPEYNFANLIRDVPMRARRTDHVKEEGPSLSIVNSLDVLRKSLLMELSRRKMELDEKQKQINAELLKMKG